MAWWVLLVAAAYPAVVTLLLVALPVVQPRSGPLALAAVLAMHLTLASLVFVPIAFHRDARPLRLTLIALAVVSAIRFGDEWISIAPARAAAPAAEIALLSWNLEYGARPGEDVIEGLRGLDLDVVALQELSHDHASAIQTDADLQVRFPYRELMPADGVFGMGLLSAYPILRSELSDDPMAIEAVLDLRGTRLTVISAHPLPGRIRTVGPVPISFDPTLRDAALARFRTRVESVMARHETLIVVGDFNVAPTETAFGPLVDGLADAHAEVGIGPGWTWRPSRFESIALGLLRIDLALSGPGATPTYVAERCNLPGDHCQLEATFALDAR
jgi:endonuclease/exonuclease/phosphatase (EEP) superfamily protein YafD